MTLEEAQAKLAAMTKERDDALAETKQLKENISRQNSYITKLENSRATNSEPAPKTATAETKFDPTIQAYLEKNMRRDVLEEAKAQLLKEVTEAEYKAVEEDFLAFLEKNMKNSNCTVAYIVDAFSLVMGRALRNKEHAINKLGKGTQTPETTPTQITPTTNSNSVQSVQTTILNNTPPVMTGKDTSASVGAPNTGVQHNNTRDAFKSLKQRFANLGGGQFN
jgi:hypothetical protein